MNHKDIIISFEGPVTCIPQSIQLIEILDNSGSWYELKVLSPCSFYIDYRGYFEDLVPDIEKIDKCQILRKDETGYVYQ